MIDDKYNLQVIPRSVLSRFIELCMLVPHMFMFKIPDFPTLSYTSNCEIPTL